MSEPALIWCDDRHLYLQFACPPGGQPYIMKLSMTEGGLGKGVNLIKKFAKADRQTNGQAHVTYTKGKAPPQGLTKERDATITELLRKKGYLG